MKIDQELVTKTFQCRNGTIGCYNDIDDVHIIQDVLKSELGVIISESESIDFWRWRCEQWDGSWFGVNSSDTSEITEFFKDFIKFVGVEPNEDNEKNIVETPPKVGVKMVVKDVDDISWEIELESNYHQKLIEEIESQIPEKSENGTIRFALEYDPTKIIGIRKLGE
jgi:hypothetical protein